MRRAGLLLLIAAVACGSPAGTPGPDCLVALATARFSRTAALRVDIADDDTRRAQGLMGVTDLPADRGMAFVWDAPTDGTFWMKDTLIPLSIAFVDDAGRVVTIREMTPCEADPCPRYAASAPYRTAIEANAGWFEHNDVQVGDRMSLQRSYCT
jgi:uncharacterized membrane protein (UPF0127 family)